MVTEEVESKLKRFFGAKPDGAIAVYLFGSVARRTSRSDSDVDLGILYAQPPPRTLEGMPFELEAKLEALLERPVQIVVLNAAPPDLVHRVLRDGMIILDLDKSRRLRFEVKARNEFFDLQPYLKLYRKKSLERDDRSGPRPEEAGSHPGMR